MSTTTLDLMSFKNFEPLNKAEQMEINGGGILSSVLKCLPVIGGVIAAVDVISTAWDCGEAFGQGLVDGYNSTTKK